MFGTAETRKPFRVDAVVATSCQSSLIGFSHVRFYDGSHVESGQGHVGGIRVHLAVREISNVDVDVQEIIVELEHP